VGALCGRPRVSGRALQAVAEDVATAHLGLRLDDLAIGAGAGSRSSSSSSLRSCSLQHSRKFAAVRQHGKPGGRSTESPQHPESSYCCRSNNRWLALLCGCWVSIVLQMRTSLQHRFGVIGGTMAEPGVGEGVVSQQVLPAADANPPPAQNSPQALVLPLQYHPTLGGLTSLRASLAGLSSEPAPASRPRDQPPSTTWPWGSQVETGHHFQRKDVDDLYCTDSLRPRSHSRCHEQQGFTVPSQAVF